MSADFYKFLMHASRNAEMLCLRRRGAGINPRRVGKAEDNHFVYDSEDDAAPAMKTRESVRAAACQADAANYADVPTTSKKHPVKQTGV